MKVYQIFCRNNFPLEDFLDTLIAFSSRPIEKICLDFRREKLWIRNEKKINIINFLDKSIFHQNIPLDSWKAVRKTSTKFFHQVSKRCHPMPHKNSRSKKNFSIECFLQKLFWRWKMQFPQICKKIGQKFKKYITENRKWFESSRFLILKKQNDSSKHFSGQKEGSFQNLGIEYLPRAMFFPSEA